MIFMCQINFGDVIRSSPQQKSIQVGITRDVVSHSHFVQESTSIKNSNLVQNFCSDNFMINSFFVLAEYGYLLCICICVCV